MAEDESITDLHNPANLKVRDEWMQGLRYSTEQFDKNVLWVAAGGFTVAYVFVDKIVPLDSAIWLWLFFSSCLIFGAIIIIALISHYRSIQVNSWCVDNYDDYVLEHDKFMIGFEIESKKVRKLNRWQIGLLIPAFVLLIIFTGINLYNMENNKKPETKEISIDQKRGAQSVQPVKPIVTQKPDSGQKKK